MLGAIHFNDQLCRCAIKIYNKSADDSLLVNFRWVFAEEKIPQLAFMGRHFPAKPPSILQLAIVFWYGHITLSVLASLGHLSQRERQTPLSRLRRQLSQRESQGAHQTHHTEQCIEVRPYIYLTYWNT